MYLGNNKLTGSIPSSIFNNSMLQDIEIGSCNLTGTLPSDICSGLPNLLVLYVAFNQFSGQIPSIWRHCQALTDLDLSGNEFSGGPIPNDIVNLTSLQSIYLDGDNLQGKLSVTVSGFF